MLRMWKFDILTTFRVVLQILAVHLRSKRLMPVMVCFLSCCMALPVFAANICVGPAASGVGDGTDWNNVAAWSSVSFVRNNVYYLQSGHYTGIIKKLNTATQDSNWIWIKAATATAHGTNTGWRAGYAGTVIFDGGSKLQFSTGSDYWDVDGVTGGGPGSWTSGHGILFTGDVSLDIEWVDFGMKQTLDHIYFHRVAFTQSGNYVSSHRASAFYQNGGSLNNFTVEYCLFDNITFLPWFLRSGSNWLIQYNYSGAVCGHSVYNQNDHCEVLVEYAANDVDFRYNYIEHLPSSGGFVKNGEGAEVSDRVRIYGNVFEGPGENFPMACNQGTCSNWTVVNNTFHHCAAGPISRSATISNMLFYNNIMFGFTALGPEPGTETNVSNYNWYSQSSGFRCTMNAGTQDNICKACSAGCDSCTEQLDPFENSSGHTPEDFMLKAHIANSPGLNLCASLLSCDSKNTYNIDAFGNTRGSDGVWDRGAYQSQKRSNLPVPSNVRIVPSQ